MGRVIVVGAGMDRLHVEEESTQKTRWPSPLPACSDDSWQGYVHRRVRDDARGTAATMAGSDEIGDGYERSEDVPRLELGMQACCMCGIE